MAFKPPPTAKVVDDDAAFLVPSGTSDLNEDEAAKKRGRKMLMFGLAIVVLLAVIATGVGVGVTASKKKHNDKGAGSARAAAPTSTPSTATDYTVEDLKFLPAPGTPEAEALRLNGTAETKLAYQMAEDAKNITPEKVIKFLDYLDGVANLTAKGVDLQYYKDQAYFVALWFRSRGYTAALEMLRGYANGEVPSLLQLGQSLEQVISVLQAKKDFKAFMAWPSDGDKELDAATLASLNATDADMARRLAPSLNTVGGGNAAPPNTRAAYNPSSLTNPIYQYENVVNPKGFMNNPNIMGYPGFKLVTVRVVFHVLMFNDGGYAAPINAYTYGANPGRHLIAVMNKAYRRARVQFVLDEWRNDPNKWHYLNMGNVAKWQYCANKAEACHCKLALRHNKDPRRYVNLWVSGSQYYPGSESPDIGYSSLIPRALDSCQQTLGWKQPPIKTAHLWFLWDEIDPASGNNPAAYEDGGMTVIHEMGHYFGLLHTHQGDCANQDGIPDTPGQFATQDMDYYDRLVRWCQANFHSTKAPTKPLKSMDSCHGDKYIDNVFNYMSYTHSACYKLFTQAQVKRMQRFIQDYHHRWVVPKKKKKATKGK